MRYLIPSFKTLSNTSDNVITQTYFLLTFTQISDECIDLEESYSVNSKIIVDSGQIQIIMEEDGEEFTMTGNIDEEGTFLINFVMDSDCPESGEDIVTFQGTFNGNHLSGIMQSDCNEVPRCRAIDTVEGTLI